MGARSLPRSNDLIASSQIVSQAVLVQLGSVSRLQKTVISLNQCKNPDQNYRIFPESDLIFLREGTRKNGDDIINLHHQLSDVKEQNIDHMKRVIDQLRLTTDQLRLTIDQQQLTTDQLRLTIDQQRLMIDQLLLQDARKK